jgi:hypothetical protein
MDVGIQVLVLGWIVLFAAGLQWARVTNRGASVATWFGLTAVTWWFEFVVAFIALHTVLFSLGREAAMALAIVTLAVFTVTPVAWAYGLRHWHKARSAHG